MPSELELGIHKIIQEFKLSMSFPKPVLQEARDLGAEPSRREVESRVDLREEIIVTIDGETAKDFDDAVSVSERPGGGYCLKVSIADVSHFVKRGTAIDREAYSRATSTYFPDRVLPMLPEKLSNELCSLVPHEDRLTVTAEMDFDASGLRIESRFYRSIIRSAARLTYTLVRKILEDKDTEARTTYAAILPHLTVMGELARLMQARRSERGSIDFDLPEPFIDMDLEEGRIDRIVKAERNMAHRLIEEFMIAANEAVAERLTELEIPALYRIHDEPDPERLRDFQALIHHLGIPMRWGKKISSRPMAELVLRVRGTKEERLINTVLLRTMKQATYDPHNIGHFGLASPCYTHFTSPIRRYPDLIVHRALTSTFKGGQGEQDMKNQKNPHPTPLKAMAVHCSERERNSMKAEWASRDLAVALFMQTKKGQRFQGIIAQVTRFGFFVELEEYYVQGLVSLRDLKDDFYVHHEKTHILQGRKTKKRYSIGMPVEVRVRGANLQKRWVDFEI